MRITTHTNPDRPHEILVIHENGNGATATHVDRNGNRAPADITAQDAAAQGWAPTFRREA